jgi:hypothetical protein
VKNTLLTKQLGDACEHFVVSQLALKANLEAIKMPDCWPRFDILVTRSNGDAVRISVKSRREISPTNCQAFLFDPTDGWDFLALVRVGNNGNPTVYLLPRAAALNIALPNAYACDKGKRRIYCPKNGVQLEQWRDNYELRLKRAG